MRAAVASLVACAVSGTIAAQAMAVATPVSPASGATVSSAHPVFTWTVPANEESDGIYMATAPATTPEGRFHDENVVDLDAFLDNETSWSPTSPLAANTYWWLVGTPDRETFDSFFSSPISFTIPAEADIASARSPPIHVHQLARHHRALSSEHRERNRAGSHQARGSGYRNQAPPR